jgi:hypothetical protein
MMSPRLPPNDPIKADQRKAVATRRVGEGAVCSCGESRPEALIAGTRPITCAACKRGSKGNATMESHHLAGKSNNPLTVPVPVNDHRAELSVVQYDWPKQTRENPDRSPLVAAAACIRGFVDWIYYVIEKGLLWIAEMLEGLDALLAEQLGPKWWLNTPLARFAPKG